LAEDGVLVILASRAVEGKGWDAAIDAVGKARSVTNRDVRLLLVGDGPYLSRCQRNAAGKRWVHFWGATDDVSALVCQSDLGVLPSEYVGESFPIFVLDCLAQGVPVVATDVGEVRTILEGSASPAGRVVPAGLTRERLAEELALAIAAMIGDRNMLERLSTAARQRAAEFSVDRLVDVYESALAPGAARRDS
jgi:glycosyltransferase involved in cell wall biosynthesis